MRVYLSALILGIISIIASLSAHECSLSSAKNSKRMYIAPKQLWIDEKGIFVEMEGNLTQTSALFHDEMGMYVTSDSMMWTCGNGHASFDGTHCRVFRCPYYLPYDD